MNNPLAARKREAAPSTTNLQERANAYNQMAYTHNNGWFYFVREVQTNNGQSSSLDYVDMPSGTKAWLRDNPMPAKAYIAKATGGSRELIEEAYLYAMHVASSPNRRE